MQGSIAAILTGLGLRQGVQSAGRLWQETNPLSRLDTPPSAENVFLSACPMTLSLRRGWKMQKEDRMNILQGRLNSEQRQKRELEMAIVQMRFNLKRVRPESLCASQGEQGIGESRLLSIDFTKAFLYGEMEREVFIELPYEDRRKNGGVNIELLLKGGRAAGRNLSGRCLGHGDSSRW